MRLNKNSWHVVVNDYVYGKGYSLANHNLCPYFWGTILATLGCMPVMFARAISNIMSDGIKTFLSRYGIGSFNVIIGVIFSFITGEVSWLIYIGIALILLNAVLFNTGLIERLLSRPSKPRIQREHKPRNPSMTIAMLKGWKNKHCPMVEWE